MTSHVEDARPPRAWPPLGRVALATVVVVLVAGAFSALAAIVDVLLLGVFAVLLAVVLHAAIDGLARRMPRPLAALLTLLGVFALITGFFLLVVPLLLRQGTELWARLPDAILRVQQFWREHVHGTPFEQLELDTSVRERVGETLGAWVQRAIPLAIGTVTLAGTIVLVIAVAMFLAYDPRAYLNGIVRLIPSRHTRTAVTLLHRLGVTLRGWILGTLALMTIVGGLTAIGLSALGIEGWFVLALIHFFGEFVPYVGPVAASIPGIAVGLSISPAKGAQVALLYLAVQQVENHLLQPLVMKRAVRLQPALTILWQLALGSVSGVLAVLVATPVLACLQVAVQYLWIERHLGKAPGRRA